MLRRIPFTAMSVLAVVVAALAIVQFRGSDSGSAAPNVSQSSVGTFALPGMLKSASNEQLELLSDGIVTRSDYLSASERYVRCVEEGLPGVVAIVNEGYLGHRAFEFRYSDDYLADGPAAIRQCWEREFNAVSSIWEQSARPDEAYLQQARNALGNCLRERGVDAPIQPTSDDLTAVLELVVSENAIPNRVVGVCSREVGERSGLPGFFG